MQSFHQKSFALFFALICVSFWTFLVSSKGHSQLLSYEKKIMVATPINPDKIKIDGKTDETVWQKLPRYDDFVQQDPLENQSPTEKTIVQIGYSKYALFIAIRAYDSMPETIIGRFTRRDHTSASDWLAVMIDSYNDHRTAFYFAVNPSNVKIDKLITNDGDAEDLNWNPVWEVATSRNRDGWSAEFKIPFSQLRFSSLRDQTWGFQLCRTIRRLNEIDYWNPEPKDAAGIVSNFGELRGLKNLSAPKNLELLPYALTSGTWSPREIGNPFATGFSHDWNAGLDLKYGLTSNLTLNATFNPDFGQVEADPSELNLTAYETYFEEKRPFFVEGKNLFQANLGLGGNSAYSENLFYSRRIGRPPRYYPSIASGSFLKVPEQTHILGAAKITGKSSAGFSLGILDAVTNAEKATIQTGARHYSETVEPLTNYAVIRGQKDYRQGRTIIGSILTNVYRNLPNKNFYFLDTQATTGGIDISHRWGKDTYALKLSLYGSAISGHKEALQRVQLSSAHYFQRPDADHLHYNPNRTSMYGIASVFYIGKIAQGHWRGGIGYVTRTPGFEANDIGYMRSADFLTAFYWAGFIQYAPGSLFRNYSITQNLWETINYGGDRKVLGGNISTHFRFINYWEGYLRIDRESKRLDFTALRGGPALLKPARTSFWFGMNSDDRKSFSLTLDTGFRRDDQGFWSGQLTPGISARPSDRLNFSIALGYYPNTDDLQYIQTTTASGGQTEYILGRIHQKTFALTTRVNYSFTPNLSLQAYSQPYISAGWYSHFKRITHPRAGPYENRFEELDPVAHLASDFNFKQFRANIVLRWEYHPGSTLFVVWSQGQTDFENRGSLNLTNDMSRLLSAKGDRTFLIKLNHWFSY